MMYPKPPWIDGGLRDPGLLTKVSVLSAAKFDILWIRMCLEVKLSMAVSVSVQGTN